MKKAKIFDHSQWLSSGPADIKVFGIALRMHFLNTLTSETELSIKKISSLIDEGLKWVKYRLKKKESPLLKKSKTSNELA